MHKLMLGTIGAVLAGSLFGRQCSLFGHATITASAGAGCDHFDHVFTQLPYALAVGGISLVLGYLPAGMGYSPGMLLPLGTLALFALVQFLGRPPAGTMPESAGGSPEASVKSAVDDMLNEIEGAKPASSATAPAKPKAKAGA